MKVKALGRFSIACSNSSARLECRHGLNQVGSLRCGLASKGAIDCKAELLVLRSMLERELEDRKFVYLPTQDQSYLEHRFLFGKEVASRLALYNREATEAGSCMALGLYTASAFHLIRAVEHGMTTLAGYLGVALVTFTA